MAPHLTCRSDPRGMRAGLPFFWHDGAISRYDCEHRLASPIWRWAQQCRPDRAGVERAWDELMRLWLIVTKFRFVLSPT